MSDVDAEDHGSSLDHDVRHYNDAYTLSHPPPASSFSLKLSTGIVLTLTWYVLDIIIILLIRLGLLRLSHFTLQTTGHTLPHPITLFPILQSVWWTGTGWDRDECGVMGWGWMRRVW